MPLDWLRAEVLRAARATLAALPPDDYCGFALYSDDGAMTVCCSVNTAAHLARAQAADPDDGEYHRWSPAEWALEGVGDFDGICRQLRAEIQQSMDFGAFRDAVFETCVAALETLVAAGELRRFETVVFTVSDTGDPFREVAWVRRLNPPARADRFAEWMTAQS